jgi:hypothetical protein
MAKRRATVRRAGPSGASDSVRRRRPSGPPDRVRGRSPSGPPEATDAGSILGTEDASLLDIVDNVLSKGVVLNGDITIGLAQVDLVYARLSVLLCAADRVMPSEDTDVLTRHSKRHDLRVKAGRA